MFMSDYYELAMILVGLDPEDEEVFQDEDRVRELLEEKYGIDDFENFEVLIKDLMQLIDVGESTITKQLYKGFSVDGKSWLCKIKARN